MSTAAVDVAPTNSTTSTGEDTVVHIVCFDCYPPQGGRHIAYCSKDVSGETDKGEWNEPEPDDCVVCVDLADTHQCDEQP